MISSIPTWALETLQVALLVLVAVFVYRVTLRLGRGAMRRAAERTAVTWDDRIIERRVLALGCGHPYMTHLHSTFQSDVSTKTLNSSVQKLAKK